MRFPPKFLSTPALVLAAGLCVGVSARADEIHNPTAIFAGLDKITGRIISFDVAIDETVQFGTLQITPRVCITRPQTEAPLTEGFVQVDDVDSAKETRRIFSGWMFAASPGLHGVEHPVYDVWLKDCKDGKTLVASPSPGGADVNAPPPVNAQSAPAQSGPVAHKPRTIKPQEPEEPKVEAPTPDAEPVVEPGAAPADAASPPVEAASPPAEKPKPPGKAEKPAAGAAPAPLPPPIEIGAPPGSRGAASPAATPDSASQGAEAGAAPPQQPKKPKRKKRKPGPLPPDEERMPLEPRGGDQPGLF
jgi:hypothetical protein